MQLIFFEVIYNNNNDDDSCYNLNDQDHSHIEATMHSGSVSRIELSITGQ